MRVDAARHGSAAQADGVLRRLLASGDVTERSIADQCGCTMRTVRSWFLADGELSVPRAKARESLAAVVERHSGADERGLLQSAWQQLLGDPLDSGDATTAPVVEGAPDELSIDERILIVDQAMLVLEGLYAHLPFKRALHAVDPVQRLRLIRHRLSELDADAQSIDDFHREMIDVFTTVRDLHTTYLVPEPMRSATVLLPFRVEQFFETGGDAPTYVVGKVADDEAVAAGFVDGVRITHWNGVPIDRAVEVLAERQAAGNQPAAELRALDALTIRPLLSSMVPDEAWVDVTFEDGDGEIGSHRFHWLRHESEVELLPDHLDTELGFDAQTLAISRVRKELYAKSSGGHFRVKTTDDGRYGYVRIFSFPTRRPGAFVNVFAKLVAELPQTGLIIDVRGNGGGSIRAAEGILQVLADGPISPSRFQFLGSPLALRLSRSRTTFRPWVASLRQAAIIGATHSRSYPITPPEFLDKVTARYPGPAVLIVDAICYSATDMFAAGFIDHGIGPVLGTSNNTGAGGGNVLTHASLRELMGDGAGLIDLPGGVNFRVAIRRTLRVRERQGEILEDLGIAVEHRHYMTRRDVFDGNADLIAHATRLLDEHVASGSAAS